MNFFKLYISILLGMSFAIQSVFATELNSHYLAPISPMPALAQDDVDEVTAAAAAGVNELGPRESFRVRLRGIPIADLAPVPSLPVVAVVSEDERESLLDQLEILHIYVRDLEKQISNVSAYSLAETLKDPRSLYVNYAFAYSEYAMLPLKEAIDRLESYLNDTSFVSLDSTVQNILLAAKNRLRTGQSVYIRTFETGQRALLNLRFQFMTLRESLFGTHSHDDILETLNWLRDNFDPGMIERVIVLQEALKASVLRSEEEISVDEIQRINRDLAMKYFLELNRLDKRKRNMLIHLMSLDEQVSEEIEKELESMELFVFNIKSEDKASVTQAQYQQVRATLEWLKAVRSEKKLQLFRTLLKKVVNDVDVAKDRANLNRLLRFASAA